VRNFKITDAVYEYLIHLAGDLDEGQLSGVIDLFKHELAHAKLDREREALKEKFESESTEPRLATPEKFKVPDSN
tara:strand:+ start:739 stop:963 length:225 start_codon:yes stop_codon:yes gene_type:complete